MGRWKIGSFTAALGCIAVGIIVAMAQYGVITYAALGYLWPALLILFGVEMLLRLFVRSDTKSRISGWAVVLIVLLVAASAGQTVLAGGTLSSFLGNNRLAPLSGTQEIGPEITTVKIIIPDGKIKVIGEAAGSALQYEGSLLVSGSSDSEAAQELKKRWKISTREDTLVLELEENDNWLANIQIGFVIKSAYLNVNLPENLAVEVESGNGSIEASGIQSGLTVDSSNGKLDIQDIKGGLNAHSSNGSLTIKNIQGETELVSSNGAMTLDNIDGALTAKSSNGRITLNSAVKGDWKLTSYNGKIMLGVPADTDAKVTADSSNGSLKGNLPWVLEEGEDNNHGTAVLGKGTYEVNISSSNGSVTVDTGQ
ncbi:DUF4097 family beta strand repeat protein [Paenibacillus albidus]|uniref:DUF4097 family beta strand repeat-containing protein n=1 Tax=Paenibacillus albidus TaxID=2041023 RepID=UPI001BECD34D|nr:DUF4097 family beta strand repeat-containing protein [Paenibacillus albidus]MBT2289782.1 DUF4097 family beta strand repeat protein [Paenibacillus albidus]